MSVPFAKISRRWINASLATTLLLGLAPLAARGQGADPAAVPIGGLYGALLDTMKQAKQLGVKGRYDKLAPVLFKTYDVASMSRIAVGQSWDTLEPAQQSGVIDAFSRMMIATYANRFDDFSGEQFEIVQTVDQPPADKIVKTRIIQSNGKAVALNYLMRRSGTEWMVVDVYLDGTISELASRRAEFSAILKSGGPDALIDSLRRQGDKLLAGA
jgi:phospholipid transport system substrate-binding protein